MARIRHAALVTAAFVIVSCSNVTMIDGWSIGRPTTSSERCDFADVAQKAFQKAFPGKDGSGMQLYSEGQYVASNGRVVGLSHTGKRVVAVFTLGNGRHVAVGMGCEIGPAFERSPPDKAVIDSMAGQAEAYEHRTPRPTK